MNKKLLIIFVLLLTTCRYPKDDRFLLLKENFVLNYSDQRNEHVLKEFDRLISSYSSKVNKDMYAVMYGAKVRFSYSAYNSCQGKSEHHTCTVRKGRDYWVYLKKTSPGFFKCAIPHEILHVLIFEEHLDRGFSVGYNSISSSPDVGNYHHMLMSNYGYYSDCPSLL